MKTAIQMPRAHRILAASLLALALWATSAPAQAQAAGRVPRIGYLALSIGDCKPTARDEAFLVGLRERGWQPGKNITVEQRCYANDAQMKSALAELVNSKVDVLVAATPGIAAAARNLSREVPIVCASCGDPVAAGLAQSLSRPGGNITGLASLSAELLAKRVQLMKEALPSMRRISVMVFPLNPGIKATHAALDEAAMSLKVAFERHEIREAADFEPAFRQAKARRADAVLLQDDPLVPSGAKLIAELALANRLPTMGGSFEIADAGILLVYGPNRVTMFRASASFVDRILKGARPADMPIEQARELDLIVNLKAAKAMGLKLPGEFLLRAARTIE